MLFEIIASCFCLLVMVIFVPQFLKAAWPEKTNKSLLLKMLCATLFVAIAVLQMRIADNFGAFATRMMWGFVLSWFGDLFLHVRLKPKELWYALGVAAFFGGHMFFISGYTLAGDKLLGLSFWSAPEMFAVAALLTTAVVLIFKKVKVHGNRFLPLLLIYAVAVITMMVKAVGLSVRLFADGQQPWYAMLLLGAGGICFALSDFLLLLFDFGRKRKDKPNRFHSYKIKSVYIWAYFIAQVLLGLTILYIKA
ncbi:MAG: lysoplasmalogenase [Oscillospiraceae bacterium]|jgi:hypothetical protein|nr:lysoplasmalogenase [Oscillospiraceae bacterium]